MKTPFTSEQFFAVFESYNAAVFPAQLVLLLIGLFAFYLVIRRASVNSKIVGALLGMVWLWTGAVYHIVFFSPLNPVALGFGVLFILQGFLILVDTFIRKRAEFVNSSDMKGFLAKSLIIFGLLVYPVISYFLEGALANVISFGLPCPTTIATFGFLMLAGKTISRYLLIIPALWAVLVIPVALNFGIYQDFILIVSATIAFIYLYRTKKNVVSVQV